LPSIFFANLTSHRHCWIIYPPPFIVVNYYSYYLSFDCRSSSCSGCCFPTVEHSVAEHHIGAVTDCFRKLIV